MCASPSAVTRFGCGEIGRSGNSSTPSSSSLTNALLMQSAFAPIYCGDYMGSSRRYGSVEGGRCCTAPAAVLCGTIPPGKSSLPLGARSSCATPPAAGNRRPSGGCDAPNYDASSYDAPSVDDQCSRSDAAVHRPGGARANCAATRSVTTNCAATKSLTGRACAGSQAQSYAGAASHHQRVRQGYEGRRDRRSGNGRRADTAGHQSAADAERRRPEGPAGQDPQVFPHLTADRDRRSQGQQGGGRDQARRLRRDAFRESLAPPLSCPAKAGHPVITQNLVVTGPPP